MQNIFHSTEPFRTEHIYLLNAYTIKAFLESCIRLNTSFGLNAQWHLTRTYIATYTIKAVDDPRTLNKILYVRPPHNTLSFNDVLSLWEKNIGKTLEKIYVPEEQVLKDIEGEEFF